jgi:hypothetical protein
MERGGTLPGVIIGLVQAPSGAVGEFLRWAVLDAGDTLLERSGTVETMACTQGSIGGTPGDVRFDALIWADEPGDIEGLLTEARTAGLIDGWGTFVLGAQRSFERRAGPDPMAHDDDPFAGLAGVTVPGMKKVVFHRRRDDVTVDDYRSIFRNHCPLTEVHMAHALRYWQREVDGVGGPSALVADGVSEFRAADHDRILSLYDNAQSAAIVGADSALFIERSTACTLFGVTHVRMSPRYF